MNELFDCKLILYDLRGTSHSDLNRLFSPMARTFLSLLNVLTSR